MAFGGSIITGLLAKNLLGYSLGEVFRLGKRRVLNLFGVKTHAQKVETSLEEVESKLDTLQEKNEELEEARGRLQSQEERISRFESIMRSLERKGISRQELIQKYGRPLPIIYLSYTKQEAPDISDGKFIRETLSQDYDVRSLGGGNVVIPPQSVPNYVESSEGLEEWIEEEVYQGRDDRKSIIRFATVADLSKDVFWRDDFEYQSRYGTTVGEALGIDEIFSDAEFVEMLDRRDKTALNELIRRGDIGFFAARWVPEDDLDTIHQYQNSIEDELDDKLDGLSLHTLADKGSEEVLSDVLSDYVSDENEAARGIVREASVWETEVESLN